VGRDGEADVSVTVALKVIVSPAANVWVLGPTTTLVESSRLIPICPVAELGAWVESPE